MARRSTRPKSAAPSTPEEVRAKWAADKAREAANKAARAAANKAKREAPEPCREPEPAWEADVLAPEPVAAPDPEPVAVVAEPPAPEPVAAPKRTPTPRLVPAPAPPPAPTPKAAVGSLLDALDDPNLFQPSFKGEAWNRWKVFLRALFAEPMGTEDLEFYRQCTGRTKPPTKAFQEAALIVGRRGGKSRILATIAVYLATFRDYTPFLAPGEVATVMVLAVDKRQARTIFRYASGLLKATGILSPMVVKEDGESITLNNRVVIEIGTASFRSTRGYSLAAILADELCFWLDSETSCNPANEILRALRPGMSSIPGSIMLLASSPYGKTGVLYETFRKHYGRDNARTLVWKASTETMNTTIDPAIIAEAYEEDPESARSEYGAEWRDDLAAFVTREIVDAVTMWGCYELPPEPGINYVAFCDPSGGSSDSMTLAVGHLRQDGDVAILDALLEVRAPFNPDEATEQCAAVLKRYGVTRVTGDHYAGAWPVAGFAKHGIAFVQSADPKSTIYGNLLPLLNSKRVQLLEHKRMSAQLVALERRTSRSGKDSIDHPPSGHDDCINSVAGVLVALDLDRRPSLATDKDVLNKAGEPEDLPQNVVGFLAVIAVDSLGQCAVVYAALAYPALAAVTGVKLYIADYDLGPLHPKFFNKVMARLTEMMSETRTKAPMPVVIAATSICNQAAQSGLTFAVNGWDLPFFFTPVKESTIKPEDLALSVAYRMRAGEVKITPDAWVKSQSSPLGSALTLRGGEKADNPLRQAVIQAVMLSLDQRV